MTTELINRRHLIERQLRSALSSDAAQCAMTLYDDEFAPAAQFVLADYCRRLSLILPDFPLPRETRLSLLRELRQLDRAPMTPPRLSSEVA